MVKGVLIYNYRQRWKKYADMHEFFADMLNTNIIDSMLPAKGGMGINMVKGGKTE